LTTLGFQGEIDFHTLGAGYKSHAVYVSNPAPSAKLPMGLNYRLDDGKTWKKSAAQGISGEPIQIAVHPAQVNVVAVAGESGLFLSTDFGNSFERVGALSPVTAAAFAPTGETLLFGLQKLYARPWLSLPSAGTYSSAGRRGSRLLSREKGFPGSDLVTVP
jgi:hypothetical protein